MSSVSSGQFTFTCISTGGPATTVTWTRGNSTITEGTETLLNDPQTAQYTHTLNVTNAGVYTCTAAMINYPLIQSAFQLEVGRTIDDVIINTIATVLEGCKCNSSTFIL